MQSGDERQNREEVLKELQEYRTIFEISGSSIAIAADDGTINRVNAEFVKLFGYSKEEVEGRKKWSELCAAEDRDRINHYHQLRRSNPDSAPHNYEARFIHKNGGLIHAYITAGLIPKTQESVLAVIDISNLKKAEETARVSERSYRQIFNSVNDAIIVHDAAREIIVDANTKASEMFGYTLEEIKNTSLKDRVAGKHPYSEAILRDFINKAAKGAPQVFEWLYRHKDGRTFSTEISLKDAVISGDQLVLAIIRDITERKRAEEAFRETNAYLENLLNYANAPIIVWDPDYNITRFNRAFERLTGYRADEVLGKSLEILFPDDKKEDSMGLIRRTASGERWEVVEIAIAHVDQTVRTVLWNSATLFAPDGTTVVATIAQGQDITARKRAEEELRQSHEKLESRVRERTAELEKLNEALRGEIEERKRAEEIISRQAQEILEVSTPVIQIWEGIVSVPLIGTLDSMRAQQLMEQLLQRIVETGSAVALLDVTGVPAIDSKTARYLIETISAVRLLGAEVVLTGIRPAIARTLAQLGVDLSNVNTRSSFSAGLLFALTLLKLRVVSHD